MQVAMFNTLAQNLLFIFIFCKVGILDTYSVEHANFDTCSVEHANFDGMTVEQKFILLKIS